VVIAGESGVIDEALDTLDDGVRKSIMSLFNEKLKDTTVTTLVGSIKTAASSNGFCTSSKSHPDAVSIPISAPVASAE
jgi:hypothetical protein